MSIRVQSLFSKKIKCLHCGSNFKRKKERNKNKYVCTLYDNKKECIRIPIEEDFLIELIERRLNKKVDRYIVEKCVDAIVIEDSHLMEIFMKDQESILLSRSHIRY